MTINDAFHVLYISRAGLSWQDNAAYSTLCVVLPFAGRPWEVAQPLGTRKESQEVIITACGSTAASLFPVRA